MPLNKETKPNQTIFNAVVFVFQPICQDAHINLWSLLIYSPFPRLSIKTVEYADSTSAEG